MKNQYIEQLNQELADYASRYGVHRAESILDLLWYCYSAANPIDDGKIQAAEKALAPVFQELSFEASDALFDLVFELCTAYQRAAFLEGIQIGVQIATELGLEN